MYHKRLFAHLKDQSKKLRSGAYIEALGTDMKYSLQTNAPSQTGTLIKNLGTTPGVKDTPTGFHMGFGPRSKVGESKFGARRGTIAAFLRDYPQFRRNWSFVVAMGGAWAALSREGREKLQEQRLSGSYGGGSQGVGVDMSAYLYPQEGTLDKWADSAKKANITPMHFIDIGITEWRSYSIQRVMRIFRRDMGINA